jgi:hypothetical protein
MIIFSIYNEKIEIFWQNQKTGLNTRVNLYKASDEKMMDAIV